LVERLVAAAPGQVTWTQSLPGNAVADALDAATVLVLPSRSEGLGRVVVEAFCRGRAVVGSRVGGIPDLVTDGENGLLVPAEDPEALPDALLSVLSHPPPPTPLPPPAPPRAVELWTATPEDSAAAVGGLVEQVVAG